MVSRVSLFPRWQRAFMVGICTIALLFYNLRVISSPAFAAAVPLSKQPPITKTIGLGNAGGELRFTPDRLTFNAGTRYRLMLENSSPLKHYFTAKDFADAIWSQKVDAGNVEVKGAIHELELRPGSQAEWVFIPQQAGIYPLRCTVPGHSEAGMVGTIEITG
jgi:uncharacterized cupredoxin-like copper-binding protein